MEKASGFKDKVALVVGGASGMGNAAVRLLAREGCRTASLLKNCGVATGLKA
jgi:NAD(P)-dependent dehydrogenase (short-subunit alcohol dehydrogenase family)